MREPAAKKTFIYNFRDSERYADYPQLESIGWEVRAKGSEYRYNCERIKDRHCLFQYTLAGEGRLSVRNMEYRLKSGQAFLLEKPGPYRYWLPEDSQGWEFIFLSFSLECLPFWNKLIEMHGHVANISTNASVIKMWEKLYTWTIQNRMNSFLRCSSIAYQFIMELTYYLNESHLASGRQSIVQKCLAEIHTHYSSPLSLTHLAELCEASPSYLTRIFGEQMKETPMQYLQRYRLTMACSLLLRSNFSVRDIAARVGFHDANYFSRVFTKHLHMPPHTYRISKNAAQLMNEANVNQHIEVETFSC